MKFVKFIIIISLMFVTVFSIANSRLVSQYISTLKDQQMVMSNSQWYTTIKEYAKKHNVSPIEPKIDRVWKLIPGYNGLYVDEEATLDFINKQKPKSKEEMMYIWKEIEPTKKLTDLGAYPIYRGNPNKPMVAFMINVAWGTEYLESILETLKKENIKATFFLDGSWINKNKDMVYRIVNEGHEIANHAYSHPQMSKISNDRIFEEIKKTEDIIYEITKKRSAFFTPPSGDYDQRVINIAKKLNLITVLWTLDTVDWQNPTPDTIVRRIIPNIDNGNLILMHPTNSTAQALPKLIKEIKNKGLLISTVKETLSTKRILKVETLTKF